MGEANFYYFTCLNITWLKLIIKIYARLKIVVKMVGKIAKGPKQTKKPGSKGKGKKSRLRQFRSPQRPSPKNRSTLFSRSVQRILELVKIFNQSGTLPDSSVGQST